MHVQSRPASRVKGDARWVAVVNLENHEEYTTNKERAMIQDCSQDMFRESRSALFYNRVNLLLHDRYDSSACLGDS